VNAAVGGGWRLAAGGCGRWLWAVVAFLDL